MSPIHPRRLVAGPVFVFLVLLQPAPANLLRGAEDPTPDRVARAEAQKQAARKEAFRRRFNFRRQQQAELPRNLEWVPAKKIEGRTNLTLVSGRDLGETLTPTQLETLMASQLQSEGLEQATRPISDDRFVRRAYLDVIGQIPAPADIDEYVHNKSPNKREELIDYLLAQPQYGVNWARYWRDVIAYKETAGANKLLPFADFENWLAEQLNQNRAWDEIVTDILTVTGLSTEHPEGFLFAAHEADPAQMAGEVSRIFLGIQIACAECHDHKSDVWKRDQFHELAAFFGKTAVRIRRDLMEGRQFPPIVEIGERVRRGEYRKPDLQDPSAPGDVVQPVFLTGQPIPPNASDSQRREALAQFVTSKRNPYFAKAVVNRVWAELMGFGFTNPVDDLGSQQPVAYPEVFEALARSFAASGYDVKQLIATIAKSRIYDRQFREFEDSYDNEILFTSITPTPLTADQIFDAVDWVLGNLDDGRQGGYRRQSARSGFREAFGFDPSLNKEDLEASIPQALVLMNNPAIHARMDAKRPGTLLNKLMNTQPSDREIVRMLYKRVLARNPTAEELQTCLSHMRSVSDRAEGLEDILWALLNSSEFLHNQ